MPRTVVPMSAERMSKRVDGGDWRESKDKIAHFVTPNGRARCSDGGFPKGKKVKPPTQGDEEKYCYNCHYHVIFDGMPRKVTEVLTRLMNREIYGTIRKERDDYAARVKEKEAEFSRRSEELHKREEDYHKTKQEAKDNEKYVEAGKALALVTKFLGAGIVDALDRGMFPMPREVMRGRGW